MAAEWFYAEQGQQRGPITFEQLRQRAESGQLRPTDLVWNPDLTNWVPASTQPGLFGAAAPPTPPRPRPDQESRGPREEWREYDRPRPAPSSGGGWKIAFLGCGALVFMVVVCCGVIGLIAVFTQETGNERTWNLETGKHATWSIPFQKDDKVAIDVSSTGNSDIDLFVFLDKTKMETFLKQKNLDAAAKDKTLCLAYDNKLDKDCHVDFVAPANQDYWVLVVNRNSKDEPNRNGRNSGKLVFQPAPKLANAFND